MRVEQVLARQPLVVRTVAHRVKDFGRDDHLVAPGEVLQRAAEDFLAGAARIHVGGVEEVDAAFERPLDERTAGGLIERPGMPVGRSVRHRAEAEARHLEASRTESGVVHGQEAIDTQVAIAPACAAPIENASTRRARACRCARPIP